MNAKHKSLSKCLQPHIVSYNDSFFLNALIMMKETLTTLDELQCIFKVFHFSWHVMC